MGKKINIYVIGASGYLGMALYKAARERFPTVGTSTSGLDGMVSFSFERLTAFNFNRLKPGDVVYLAAAISSPDICSSQHRRAYSVNVTCTCEFIKLAIAQGALMVFFSSDTVYGEAESAFDESRECSPCGDYARMKCEVENHFSGVSSFKSIRLSYIFSFEDKFTRYLRDCNDRGVEAEIFHPFYRAVVHRADVVEALLNLATCWYNVSKQVINFGGPEILSRLGLAERLKDTCFPALKWKVIEPTPEFFLNRPRVISMASPTFLQLLGRSPRTFSEAARIEFLSSVVQK